jgi:hypothetical protein
MLRRGTSDNPSISYVRSERRLQISPATNRARQVMQLRMIAVNHGGQLRFGQMPNRRQM